MNCSCTPPLSSSRRIGTGSSDFKSPSLSAITCKSFFKLCMSDSFTPESFKPGPTAELLPAASAEALPLGAGWALALAFCFCKLFKCFVSWKTRSKRFFSSVCFRSYSSWASTLSYSFSASHLAKSFLT